VLQPYGDPAKLIRKEAQAPEGASWFFAAAPLIEVTRYLTIPLLIAMLTGYGLPPGYIGDIWAAGSCRRWAASWPRPLPGLSLRATGHPDVLYLVARTGVP
jgi:hypothetical protein